MLLPEWWLYCSSSIGFQRIYFVVSMEEFPMFFPGCRKKVNKSKCNQRRCKMEMEWSGRWSLLKNVVQMSVQVMLKRLHLLGMWRWKSKIGEMIRRSCPKHGGQPQIPTEAYKMARPMGGLEAAMVAGRHGGGSWLDRGKLCRGNYEPVSKRSRFLGLGSLRDLNGDGHGGWWWV